MSKIELVTHPVHTPQHKPSSLPPSFSLGKWSQHTPWKHKSLPSFIHLPHHHKPVGSTRPWLPALPRDGGHLSSVTHPATPPTFHKDRSANLTCPRIELNYLICDKRISQSHPPLWHSSWFKSMGPRALQLTSCVTSGKILNLSVFQFSPMHTGVKNNSTFLIGYGNIRCTNEHKSLTTVPGTQ